MHIANRGGQLAVVENIRSTSLCDKKVRGKRRERKLTGVPGGETKKTPKFRGIQGERH